MKSNMRHTPKFMLVPRTLGTLLMVGLLLFCTPNQTAMAQDSMDANGQKFIKLVKTGNSIAVNRFIKKVSSEEGVGYLRQLINYVSEDNLSPLHWAASMGFNDIINLLLNYGANRNKVGQNNWTALHLAVINGRLETVRILIRQNLDIDAVDINSWNVTHHAAAMGRLKVLQLLWLEQADFSHKGWGNWTPLFSAAYAGNTEVVKWLLQPDRRKVIDPSHKDIYLKNALDYAAEQDHQDIVKLLTLVTQ